MENQNPTHLPPEDRERLQVALDAVQPPSLDLGPWDEIADGAKDIWFFVKVLLR